MTATVYKARREEDGAVVVDWRIAETLDALAGLLADGWHATEDAALAAFWAVSDKPVPPAAVPLAEEVAFPTPVDMVDEPSAFDEPARAPKHARSKKR